MLMGTLGPLAYKHSPQIETPAPPVVNLPFVSVAMNQNDYAEVTGTVNAVGMFSWNFHVLQGNATLLGVSSGIISSTTPNTYTFKSILHANATGTVFLSLMADSASGSGVGDGLLLVKVIARTL